MSYQTDLDVAPEANQDANQRYRGYVAALTGLGIALCAVSIAVGLRMAFYASLIECPNGHFFPAGTTDFRCFAHKHAGEGTAIALLSTVLATVLTIVSLIAQHLFRRSDTAPQQ